MTTNPQMERNAIIMMQWNMVIRLIVIAIFNNCKYSASVLQLY